MPIPILLSPLLAVEDDSPVTEDVSPSNNYLSKRDLKLIGLGLAVLALALYPVYFVLQGYTNQYQCKRNLDAVSLSMNSYETNYDDRFPPLYLANGDTGAPLVNGKNEPYVWASILVNIAGFDRNRSFRCPSSDDAEVSHVEGLSGASMPITYGMYAPYSSQGKSSVGDPGNAVVVAETSNAGANGTFDPSSLKAGDVVNDAYSIGWSTGDFSSPPEGQKVPPPSVTRLAFRNTQKGVTSESKEGRHNESINVLFVDGHVGSIKAKALLSAKHWSLPRG